MMSGAAPPKRTAYPAQLKIGGCPQAYGSTIALQSKGGVSVIQTETVFVIGAGASCEFDLPSGKDLKLKIADALRSRQRDSSSSRRRDMIVNALEKASMRPDSPSIDRSTFAALVTKADSMSEGLSHATSIDDYIDSYSKSDPEIARIGKLAIAVCLIEEERACKLKRKARGESPVLSAVENTWLANLFITMASRVPSTSVEQMFEKVSFIIFNYDRCLEWYLQHALVKRFPIDVEKAKAIVEGCRIVHPYGDLGPLGKIDFGIDLGPEYFGTGDTLFGMADRLLTLSESKRVKTDQIHGALSKAQRAVFLGFGFHGENVDLLTTPNARIAEFRATAHGLSKNARATVLEKIRKISGKRTPLLKHAQLDDDHLVACMCGPLIDDEYLFLTS